ncbi:MAG: hypothetical protein JWL73_196 [Actinomycetia bacterium]|nr:hypothetical protein [Actinomycetes bacterium]
MCGTLALGLALVLAFYGNRGASSLSDLPHLFLKRGIRPGAFPYIDRPLEYPVGAGLLLFVATAIATSALGVMLVTAAGSAALCVWIAQMLRERVGAARTWRWVLALPIVLYAFQNWDVYAIAAMVFGILAFERRRDRVAGMALGLGAAVKLFPAFVVIPLLAIRLAQRDRRGALRLVATSSLTFGALNLPILLANPHGWWWPYAFQSHRQATWGTVWFYAFRVFGFPVHGHSGAQLANGVALLALAAGLAWLTVVTVRRRLLPVPAAAAAIAIFVVTGKVYSPTYDLWLVVFFILLPFGSRIWRSFVLVDLAVFVTVYGYFHGAPWAGQVRTILPVLVAVRTLVLLAFIREATRRPTAASERADAAVGAGSYASGRVDRRAHALGAQALGVGTPS